MQAAFVLCLLAQTLSLSAGVVPYHLPLLDIAGLTESNTVDDGLAKLPAGYLASLEDYGVPVTNAGTPPAFIGVDWIENEDDLQISRNEVLLNQTEEILQKVQSFGGTLAKFDGSNILTVPLGVADTFNSFSYQIAFDNLELHSDHAEIDVVAKLVHKNWEEGKALYFAAIDLKYNNRQGFVGGARLALIQDFPIEVNDNKTAIIFRGYRESTQTGTFLEFNCDGIQVISMGLTVALNPKLFTPLDEKEKYVQAFAEMQYDKKSGFMLDNLSMTPFYFKDYRDFAFSLNGLALDLDETNTTVPYINTYYQEITAAGGDPGLTYNQWVGFYCQSFKLIVGGKYLSNNEGEPLIIEGENIVIDDLGFSSLLSVKQDGLVSLGDGNMGGWAVSVDSVALKVLANDLKGFGFAGLLHIPVLDERTEKEIELAERNAEENGVSPQPKPSACLAYDAHVNPDSSSLEMNVRMLGTEDLTIPMFIADVNIAQGSHVTVKTGKDFTIKTYLNGSMGFRGKMSEQSSIKSDAFGFRGLQVSNQPGYFAVEGFSPGDSSGFDFGAFSVTFGGLSVTDHDPAENNQQLKRLRLEDLSLNFGDIKVGDKTSFTSSLSFFFAVVPDGKKQRWVGKGLQIEKFGFEGVLPGTDKVRGTLAFYYDHEVYKDGFAGAGYVKFKAMPLEIDMACMFGNTGTDGYEYSYVDVSATFSGTGEKGDKNANAFKVYSMVGGYNKNMKREQLTNFELGQPSDSLQMGGKYPSNKFTPQEGAWGIRGGVIAKIGSAAIIGARLEIEKYESDEFGFTSRFFFEGLIEIMPDADDEGTDSEATKDLVDNGVVPDSSKMETTEASQFQGKGKIGGYIRIEVVENSAGKTFEAALGVHGIIGALNFGFYGEYYRDPKTWHLFIGMPAKERRVSVGYDFVPKNVDTGPQGDEGPSLSAEIAFKAYFMIGNSEYMPKELPKPISISATREGMLVQAYNKVKAKGTLNIFGKNGLKQGKSIAFGAYFGINVLFDTKFLTIDAGADIGFDVLLTRNQPNCDNSMKADAINSWYLLGQFYAGVHAGVGLRLSEDGRSYKIFEAGVAVLVQAGAYGPTIGVGAWVIRYKILFISGSASGTFEFGESCLDYQSTFDPTNLVSDIYGTTPIGPPDENMVSINSNFILDCAVPPNRPVTEELVDFKTGNTEKIYLQVKLEAILTDEQGNVIETSNRTDNSAMVITPKQMLTPGSKVTLSVKGEAWDTGANPDVLYSNNGKTYKVDTSVVFTVDPRGIFGLTLADVSASYPLKNQEYFHIDEHDQIMLDFGKPLPSGATYSSRMEKASVAPGAAPAESGNGSWELLSQGSLSVEDDGKKLTDPHYEAWEPQQRYRWVISAAMGGAEPEDLMKLEFNTSKFRRFAEKAATAYISEPSWETDTGPMEIVIKSDEESFDFQSDGLTNAKATTDQDGAFQYYGKIRNWVPYGACKLFRCRGATNDVTVGTDFEWASINVGRFTEVALARGVAAGSFTYDIRKNFLATYNDLVQESVETELQQCVDILRFETCSAASSNNPTLRNGDPNPNYDPNWSPPPKPVIPAGSKVGTAIDFPDYSSGNYPIKLSYRIPGTNITSDADGVINFYRP